MPRALTMIVLALVALAATSLPVAGQTDDPTAVTDRHHPEGDRVEVDTVVVDGPVTDMTVQPDAGIADEGVDTPGRDHPRVDHNTDRRRMCVLTDAAVDQCCRDRASDPERCRRVDHAHDVHIRQLILRLIEAEEWEKLVRLLHRLGVI